MDSCPCFKHGTVTREKGMLVFYIFNLLVLGEWLILLCVFFSFYTLYNCLHMRATRGNQIYDWKYLLYIYKDKMKRISLVIYHIADMI